MNRSELEQFHQQLESAVLCRYWTWAYPQRHFRFLAAWPPGYLAALSRWARLPWRVRQLLSVSDHTPLEPGLRIWCRDLGFEVELLCLHEYSETQFHQLARTATPAMAFLRGLLWRADAEIAACGDWLDLQTVMLARASPARADV